MMLAVGNGPWQLTVYVLFGTLAVAVLMTKLGPIATLRDRTNEPPPEARFFHCYNFETLTDYLSKLGDDGRELYHRALAQDVMFLILYGAGFVLLIDGTLGRLFRDPGSFYRWALDAIGAVTALIDAGEDIFLRRATSHAEGHMSAARIANILTLLKWSFVSASALAVSTGAVLLGLLGGHWV